jgi:hypothetical protein
MNDVLVERRWPAPISDEEMRTAMAAAACLDIHRVTWRESLLAADRIHLFCHFEGPDAESVRIATRDAGSAWRQVWSCDIQDVPDLRYDQLARANVLVTRRAAEPVPAGHWQAAHAGAAAICKAQRVRFLRTYASSDSCRAIDLYEAADIASVERVQVESGMPFEVILPVRCYEP